MWVARDEAAEGVRIMQAPRGAVQDFILWTMRSL